MSLSSKLKQAKIAMRNAVHKITGQDKLITEYNALVSKLCYLSDSLPDSEQKSELMKNLEALTESVLKLVNKDIFYIDSFNPYKIANKKLLEKKIVSARQLARRHGIAFYINFASRNSCSRYVPRTCFMPWCSNSFITHGTSMSRNFFRSFK